MPSIDDLSEWIRNYGHEARNLSRLITDRFVWHQLWTAMDIINDAGSAMEAYLEHDFPTDTGERYLRIYGVMQALFLQQDALVDLVKAIHPAKEIFPNDVLKDVREVRNASTGHPTSLKRKGQLSAHGIVHNTMTKDGFDLLSYPRPEGKVFTHVPVRDLIEKQRTETIRILSEVVNDLIEQERTHREKFRDIKLVTVFHLVGYAFEKIFEEVRRSTPILSRWGVQHLQESLDKFAKLLKERELAVDAYESIESLYAEIEHPLAELRKFLLNEPSEIMSAKSAAVFTDALQTHFDKLRQIAMEIDEEYASEPEPVRSRSAAQ